MDIISIWDAIKAWLGENTLNIVAFAILASCVGAAVLYFTVNPVYSAAKDRDPDKRSYYARRRRKAAKDRRRNHRNVWDEMTDNRQ